MCIKKEALAQVFSCEFCKFLKTSSYRTPLVAASYIGVDVPNFVHQAHSFVYVVGTVNDVVMNCIQVIIGDNVRLEFLLEKLETQADIILDDRNSIDFCFWLIVSLLKTGLDFAGHIDYNRVGPCEARYGE